jgi:hypothetical protein
LLDVMEGGGPSRAGAEDRQDLRDEEGFGIGQAGVEALLADQGLQREVRFEGGEIGRASCRERVS